MLKSEIEIYFDGACRNVKGSSEEPYGFGIAVFLDGEYSTVFSRYGGGEKGTSNISEWHGCVEAMRLVVDLVQSCKTLSLTPNIKVFSDSQIITNQFNGTYQIKEERFKPFYNKAKEIIKHIKPDIKIEWIPRHLNQKADDLSKKGLDLTRKKIVSQSPQSLLIL